MVVDYLQTCDFLVFISEAKQWHMAIFQKNSQDDIK